MELLKLVSIRNEVVYLNPKRITSVAQVKEIGGEPVVQILYGGREEIKVFDAIENVLDILKDC